MHQYLRQRVDKKFVQKNTRYWEFSEESNTWVELKLPYDLISCVNDNCTVVDTIQSSDHHHEDREIEGSTDQVDNTEKMKKKKIKKKKVISSYPVLAERKRISLTKMSESSIWVTGESGSIYERFWNGLQWVTAPHTLPVYAGYAVSVFLVNHRILALSEGGQLHQMQLNAESQPTWVELVLEYLNCVDKETNQRTPVFLSNGVVSNDRTRMYACTKDGQLLELIQVEPPSWTNHGRPPGAMVAAVTDASAIRAGLVFIVSSAGDLYEYDEASKPAWKKHIRQEGSEKDTALAPSNACSLHGLVGPNSVSMFFFTKGGEVIERRLHQRKWKWVVHGKPKGHLVTSITCISSQDEPTENSNSLYVTTEAGFVFQYHLQKRPDQKSEEKWVNHEHPAQARVARGISGLELQAGRMMFPLDDGRLAELHLSGLGGESHGPSPPPSSRRKSSAKYVWSILDAPESEGWNAEYCTHERGPSNCLVGTKDEFGRRKDGKTQQNYLIPDERRPNSLINEHEGIKTLFRLRLMHVGKSFFIITDEGLTYECLKTENVWVWLEHEYPLEIKGILGRYNGSLFVVDERGSLIARERGGEDLVWINCSSITRGKAVATGRPWEWDGMLGQQNSVWPENVIFFVSKSGKLMEFSVALRNFKWKDCKSPPGTRVSSIVDQEGFRNNIVFVIGKDGRLYQYNKVTGLWHEHHQSQHLILSRSTGTPARPSPGSLRGSLFMLSEEGGLVEYRWSPGDGWEWVEHGRPHVNVRLVGAPGPCFLGTELFLIGSDGNVYLRYSDDGDWKWEDLGFPYMRDGKEEKGGFQAEESTRIDQNCNPKVSSTRPIAFSGDSLIYELQDNRLAELSRKEDGSWVWSRTIATPMTLCTANYWT
ncbi:Unknown protein [Striga hermonthica]|uniref:Uncharacterized protein n=1 Tax=Striga hermonthica TaxID=68872 RepID=A0A9N7MU93_STRHE|nr:Unknown protein [Striga hermonthica]